MANEKRLVYAQEVQEIFNYEVEFGATDLFDAFDTAIESATTVDAVEVPDKKLLKAVKMLIKQYEHSKQSDYVHSPVAHALYHTWKQVDESGYGERRTDDE